VSRAEARLELSGVRELPVCLLDVTDRERHEAEDLAVKQSDDEVAVL
jgi:hypothetical protein